MLFSPVFSHRTSALACGIARRAFSTSQQQEARKKPTKAAQLRDIIQCNGNTQFLMEAHSGLSARIVEETGFKGIWASGLSISASLGLRDNNEASWTQVLDVVEYMSDATTIPILLDGDTGFGNFNNARRLVRKLEERGVGGVCIEDKLFPKTNSFLTEKQPLADLGEFVGKIKAMKDHQLDSDFMVVARVEALIGGWGMEEALKRSEAYHKAGADAILMHSKLANSSEIDTFMKHWGNRCPVVIVPTKYWKTPTSHFKDIGINTIIWANHNLRSSISIMQQTSRQIFKDSQLHNVELNIASVDEVFRLQRANALAADEDKYLPNTSSPSPSPSPSRLPLPIQQELTGAVFATNSLTPNPNPLTVDQPTQQPIPVVQQQQIPVVQQQMPGRVTLL